MTCSYKVTILFNKKAFKVKISFLEISIKKDKTKKQRQKNKKKSCSKYIEAKIGFVVV